jgi:hypothetical protein
MRFQISKRVKLHSISKTLFEKNACENRLAAKLADGITIGICTTVSANIWLTVIKYQPAASLNVVRRFN